MPEFQSNCPHFGFKTMTFEKKLKKSHKDKSRHNFGRNKSKKKDEIGNITNSYTTVSLFLLEPIFSIVIFIKNLFKISRLIRTKSKPSQISRYRNRL